MLVGDSEAPGKILSLVLASNRDFFHQFLFRKLKVAFSCQVGSQILGPAYRLIPTCKVLTRIDMDEEVENKGVVGDTNSVRD